ncbi:MAG: hypothetical protein ACRD9L_12680 [Bryobacteraceae bacterium]
MTKIQLRYPLLRPLEDSDLGNVSSLHGVYGIMRMQVAPSLDAVTVDYDATRMTEQDVESVLYRFGIPIRRTIV